MKSEEFCKIFREASYKEERQLLFDLMKELLNKYPGFKGNGFNAKSYLVHIICQAKVPHLRSDENGEIS